MVQLSLDYLGAPFASVCIDRLLRGNVVVATQR
jgi:hypothetical protein